MADDDDKKYMDVARPKGAPAVRPQNRSMLGKDADKPAQNTVETTDPTKPYHDNTITPATAVGEKTIMPISHTGMDIPDKQADEKTEDEKPAEEAPESTEAIPSDDAPQVDPLPIEAKEVPEQDNQEDVAVNGQPDTPTETESREPEASEESSNEPADNAAVEPVTPTQESTDSANTPAPTSLSAIDALPDPGEKVAKDAKAEMQDPKKEYYVPIGNTHHKHGSAKMAFLFGVICAGIVIAAVVYYMFVINK
jgi:hypothetical protein